MLSFALLLLVSNTRLRRPHFFNGDFNNANEFRTHIEDVLDPSLVKLGMCLTVWVTVVNVTML